MIDTSDFLAAAETCHRFLANALLCFPKNFERLSLTDEKKAGTARYTRLSLSHTSHFLKNFGHLIITLELTPSLEVDTLNMIAKNCSKTLLSLDIEGYENIIDIFINLSQFQALQRIN